MVYSHKSRDPIEKIRSEIQSKKISSIEGVEDYLQKNKIKRSGDLKNKVSMADALLHPMVHVFDENTLAKLLSSEPSLEVMKIEEDSNYVIFLKKL